MGELSGLPGSERYGACDDESVPRKTTRRCERGRNCIRGERQRLTVSKYLCTAGRVT